MTIRDFLIVFGLGGAIGFLGAVAICNRPDCPREPVTRTFTARLHP